MEFGHKVFLAESAQGLITQYDVLSGNPSDADYVEASLSRHQAIFGSAPQLYGSDRGFFSKGNLAACQRSRVEMAILSAVVRRAPNERPTRKVRRSAQPTIAHCEPTSRSQSREAIGSMV